MISIRAHHLLCLQGFQGAGYSDDFVSQMSAIIVSLKKNPSQDIILHIDLDDFCMACPHKGKTSCEKDPQAQTRMQTRDISTLNALGYTQGQTVPFEEAIAHSNHIFKSKKSLSGCCAQCEWQEDCLFFQERNST